MKKSIQKVGMRVTLQCNDYTLHEGSIPSDKMLRFVVIKVLDSSSGKFATLAVYYFKKVIDVYYFKYVFHHSFDVLN